MKAPDKIYVTAQRNQILGASVKPYSGGEEYIRKEAILEWAKEQIKKFQPIPYANGEMRILNSLIDKLNSL